MKSECGKNTLPTSVCDFQSQEISHNSLIVIYSYYSYPFQFK